MSLKDAADKLDKQFGKGTMRRLGDKPLDNIEVIPTGCIVLDRALGVGGLPQGRIIEIYGPESSGKTTLASHVVAEAQKMGKEAVYIDAEHALDPHYLASGPGVDVDNLWLCQPENGEMGLTVALQAIEDGAGIVVIDSVAALTPRAEIAGEMGDSHVGLQARMMSQAMRKMAGAAKNTGTTIIFINQIREKIGVMFGSPETTPGGRALKFYASVRLDIRRIGQIKDGVEIVGNETRIKVVKNKVAPPFKQCEFDILYGKGISQAGCILDVGVEEGLFTKSGSWFVDAETGEKLANGRPAAREYLNANPDVMAGYYERIMDA
jgi:recombination protein RecA